MRFNEIQPFNIDDLLLDEDNYRFTKAQDQKACVKKIHDANPAYFKGLMKSVAEDDLGEPLLVYANENNERIVADGNRRLSASKVLHNVDYAPTESIKAYAQELRDSHNIDFSNIQAQVSSNQELIAKTVHERHSGGKNGTSRIPWNAYAASRFGFDKGIGDHKEWYIMALLSRTEEEHPEIEVNRENFSYEVFRRIVRTALSHKKISENIFSERGERIKKTARADLIKDAVSKSLQFIKAIQNRELTLSRKDGEVYADKNTVDAYIDTFDLSPDNAELKKSKEASDQNNVDDTQSAHSNSNTGEETEHTHPANTHTSSETPDTEDTESNARNSGNRGIKKSDIIVSKLNQLGSKKLIGLYKSMYNVPLNTNPQLMFVGAWAFLEVLAKLAGNENDKGDRTQEFPAFFRNKFREFGINKQNGKDCGLALDEISRYGNATKHSRNCTPLTAVQLENHFEVLEELIRASIDKALSLKQAKKAE